MSNQARLSGIDLFKTVGIFSVIIYHTEPLRYTGGEAARYLQIWINGSMHFVPLFFGLISGYLWGLRIRSAQSAHQLTIKSCNRILQVYVFWCFIYLIAPSIPVIEQHGMIGLLKAPYWRLSNLWENPLRLLFEGTAGHLWFFASLLCAFIISASFVRLRMDSWLIPFSCVLYIFGLLGGTYSPTPFGIAISFTPRDGPFYLTLAFVIGWRLSGYRGKFSMKLALILLFGGIAVHMAEVYYLWYHFGKDPASLYFTVGAVPSSIGAALLVFSHAEIGKDTFLAKLGLYMPGVYAGHMLFVHLLRPVRDTFHSYVWEFAFPFIVFGLTAAMIMLISKDKFFRRFVV
jgi:surface polysaccharide O-acyltransferase-like enzyme